MNEGYCKIDPEAAISDISKINQSIELLQQAYQALSQLCAQAESMQGKTPIAISNKARELQLRINNLNKHLNDSVGAIRSAVEEYQSMDSELSGGILRTGG
ncbi:MAG: hypothetical protein K5750_09500 [Eubacterium sp.]|nr:hypothetical protein [Eubacterium sp.]